MNYNYLNYPALIENRKSVRAFRDKAIPTVAVEEIREFYAKKCHRLLPELETELVVMGTRARDLLEGAAGYEEFLVGAPQYLVLLTAPHPRAAENAGFMMEDMVLKLTDMGYGTCWLTFADAAQVTKDLQLNTKLEVAAIVAFGYGERTVKKLRLNIKNMSHVDVEAERYYYSHKKDINELVYLDKLGNTEGVAEHIGFYDDMLWQAFYAVAQAPSYLNRQPYAFVIRDHEIVLLRLPDEYTDDHSAGLNLGIAMSHFSALAGSYVGDVVWDLTPKAKMDLPAGVSIAAVYHL